jgi:hypothetical protein
MAAPNWLESGGILILIIERPMPEVVVNILSALVTSQELTALPLHEAQSDQALLAPNPRMVW